MRRKSAEKLGKVFDVENDDPAFSKTENKEFLVLFRVCNLLRNATFVHLLIEHLCVKGRNLFGSRRAHKLHAGDCVLEGPLAFAVSDFRRVEDSFQQGRLFDSFVHAESGRGEQNEEAVEHVRIDHAENLLG